MKTNEIIGVVVRSGGGPLVGVVCGEEAAGEGDPIAERLGELHADPSVRAPLPHVRPLSLQRAQIRPRLLPTITPITAALTRLRSLRGLASIAYFPARPDIGGGHDPSGPPIWQGPAFNTPASFG